MKTVAFKAKPKPAADPADAWIRSSPEEQASIAAASAPTQQGVDVPMKRFTIDVSETLHKRIKSQCAIRGVKMADVIRELLEKEFAPSS